MAEHDRTWARVAEMTWLIYPDDPDLAALHAREAFDEEHTAAYARQAEQLDAEAAAGEAEVEAARAEVLAVRAEMAEAAGEAEGRAFAQRRATPMDAVQAELAEARAEMARVRAELARVPAPPTDDEVDDFDFGPYGDEDAVGVTAEQRALLASFEKIGRAHV